jgi:TetR/AcrR family transcriptional repressor of nem operon
LEIFVRKSKAETAVTRELIVQTASREFRRNGISETGLDDIMHSAGLTHGGFYRHFDSKDKLLLESVQQALERLFASIDAIIGSQSHGGALESLVEAYLTPHRRDDYERACPLAALASELPRANSETRIVASAAVDRFIATIQRLIDDLPSRDARARATGIFATMVGGMVLSRLTDSPTTSNRTLKDAREFALRP